MAKEFSRTERLGQLIQQELAILIQQHMQDPRLDMITVSEVELSNDLAYAKVYFTIFSAQQPAEQIDVEHNVDILNKAAKYLQLQLAQRVRMKRMPNLNFIYDNSLQQGNRVIEIIDRLAATDHKNDTDQS